MILGFDTSTAATLRLRAARRTAWPSRRCPSPERLAGPPGHARELLPAMAEVMERAEIGFGELEAIAVGVGPGTFTGLRIGVATARGLASANALPLRPVSSLAALAAGIDAALALPLIDAKRGEVFAALYDGRGAALGAVRRAARGRGGPAARAGADTRWRPGTARYDFEGCSRLPG